VICIDDTNYDLTSADVNCILAIINSRCRAAQIDYWMPVCLPSITPEGYLNMYYRNLTGTTMGLVLVSSSNDNVPDAVMMCQKVEIVRIALTTES
jgi:Second Longin domain of FUZ, MON1 and HPS1